MVIRNVWTLTNVTAEESIDEDLPIQFVGSSGATKNLQTIRLPALLDLLAADQLLQNLKDALMISSVLDVNGQDVERASTPCIQILLAAAQAATESGGRLRITASSEILAGSFSELGLETHFKQWAV